MKDPNERADTRHLQRLLEGVNAKDDYLTAGDLDGLCRRPRGFWRSPHTVSAVQLPESYGKIHGFSLTPGDQPCITTEINNMITVVCGETGCQTSYVLQRADHGMDPAELVSHVGFNRDGLPVTDVYHLQILTELPHEEWCRMWPAYIYIGADKRYVCHAPNPCLTVLSDGSVLYILEPSEGVQEVYRDGQKLNIPPGRLYGREWLLASDGMLYTTWVDFDKRWCFGPYNQDPCLVKIGYPCRGIVELMDGLSLLMAWGDSGCIIRQRIDGTFVGTGATIPLLPKTYQSGLTQLPDGREIFIASARHGGECVQIWDQPLTPFDYVTQPFQKNGAWHYYGLDTSSDARFLCLMRVP